MMKHRENEPPRLREWSPSQLTREMLRSTVRDVPPPQSRQKALVAASLAASSLAASGGAAAAGVLSATMLSGLKWLVVGLCAGAVSSMGAVELSKHAEIEDAKRGNVAVQQALDTSDHPRSMREGAPRPAPALENTPHVTSAPEAPESSAPPAASPRLNAAFGGPAAPSPTLAASTARTIPFRAYAAEPVESQPRSAPAAAAVKKGEFAVELALVDRARRAVSGGAPGQALSLLDQLEREHHAGSFGPEAMAIRIEALLQKGDHSAAVLLANRFVAQHPSHPLVARVRSLMAPKPLF